uniref:Uncharacterized protein n=1 Tax=Salvator merianae TaxID=96440 RepID=A0A8D0BYB7_SALMN
MVTCGPRVLIPSLIHVLMRGGWGRVEVSQEGRELKGPELKWYWIPRYPVCASMQNGSVAIFRNDQIMLSHFDNRLEKTGEKSDLSLVLHLRILYMNDSGIFYCSNNQKNSSEFQVSVKPGKIEEIVKATRNLVGEFGVGAASVKRIYGIDIPSLGLGSHLPNGGLPSTCWCRLWWAPLPGFKLE